MKHKAQGMRQEARTGYRLTNCVVLLGAVAGGAGAHPLVRERIRSLMGHALTADKYLDAQVGRVAPREPSGVKALVAEIRKQRLTEHQELLAYARELRASGRAWAGVSQQEPAASRRPGLRNQRGVTRGRALALLASGPMTAQQMVEPLGVHLNGVLKMLKRLWREGEVEAKGRPAVWRLKGVPTASAGRRKVDHPDHHIFDNNGTYWCYYTVHLGDGTKRRVSVSLRTKEIKQARVRRDEIFAAEPALARSYGALRKGAA